MNTDMPMSADLVVGFLQSIDRLVRTESIDKLLFVQGTWMSSIVPISCMRPAYRLPMSRLPGLLRSIFP